MRPVRWFHMGPVRAARVLPSMPPAGTQVTEEKASRRAVFARELLRIGPWTSAGALKRAHQRGVLLEGIHWVWLGGVRVYYVDRILPQLNDPPQSGGEGEEGDAAKATEERLRRVLVELPPRQAALRVARTRRRAPREMEDGHVAHD